MQNSGSRGLGAWLEEAVGYVGSVCLCRIAAPHYTHLATRDQTFH